MPTFQTDRCGELVYRDEDVIQFPAGLVGMPTLTRWLILDLEDGVPLKWLQSLDRPDFGFPVTSPGYFVDQYHPGIPDTILEDLGEPRSRDLAVMIITTVHPGGQKISGNLLSPLVIGLNSHCGCQWTSADAGWPVQQEINYLKFGLAVAGDSSENGPRIANPAECIDSADESGESTARPDAELPEPQLV
jgi:flagellar assembly factor FliW